MERKKVKSATGTLSQRKKLVDEFISLDAEVAGFKHKQFRHEKLRSLILDWYPELPPDDEVTVPGTAFDVLISSRDRMRTVTLGGKKRLLKLWGPAGFLERALVLLKHLPDPRDEAGEYTQQASTGPRHLHVVAKGDKAIQQTTAA